jgi:hypothetical protein
MAALPRTWLSDPRGNPSRWVALFLAVLFAVGAVAAALLGQGPHVTGILACLFLAAFNVAFGRRAVIAEVMLALARRPAGSGS